MNHTRTSPNIAQEGAQDAQRPSRRRSQRPGDHVRVERDETRWPSRGSWPRYRGLAGTVTEVNRAGGGATEYGVGFGKSKRTAAWFKTHELTITGGLETP